MIKITSREQLMSTPLELFKSLIIETPEQEALVQEVLNIKTRQVFPQTKIKTSDVPAEIKTPEEEAYWQKILDERRAKVKARSQVQHPIAQEQSIQDELVALEAQKLELEASLKAPESTEKRFCNECDSKGVRHKKECPKIK